MGTPLGRTSTYFKFYYLSLWDDLSIVRKCLARFILWCRIGCQQQPIRHHKLLFFSLPEAANRFGGLTHVEIAERNNMPLGTVKGRMRLGLLKMRRLLEEHGLDNTW